MIAGVTVWTLSAHVSAIYVCRIIELTVWTEIVALDQKWAGASFAIVRCAFQSNAVKTGRAAIAFRAHGVMFADLSNKNKIDLKFEILCRPIKREISRMECVTMFNRKVRQRKKNDKIDKLSEFSSTYKF